MSSLETKPRRSRATGRPPGRPTKLTPALVEAICAEIREGTPPEAAAVSLGVAASTFRAWLTQGRSENATPRQREFVLAFEQANSEFHALMAKRAANDPKFTIEVLARRFRQDWRREDRSSVDVNVQLRPVVDPSRYTIDELQTLRDLLAKGTPSAEELPHGSIAAAELLAGIVEGELVSEEDVA